MKLFLKPIKPNGPHLRENRGEFGLLKPNIYFSSLLSEAHRRYISTGAVGRRVANCKYATERVPDKYPKP